MLVSVIIPTWNRKEKLQRAVNSVLAQAGTPLEILVCDDGSTDGTPEMVRDWQNRDPRVRLIAKGRGGRPAIPRNNGIEAAAGEWLAFLDDDDMWVEGKLKKQLVLHKRYGALAMCTNAFRVRTDKHASPPFFTHMPLYLTHDDMVKENGVICSSAMLHRSILDKTGGFPEDSEIAYEDYALWLRVTSLTPFYCQNELCVVYYDAPKSSYRGRAPGDSEQERLQRVYLDWLRWVKKMRLHARSA